MGTSFTLTQHQRWLAIVALIILIPLVPEFAPEIFYLIDLGGIETVVALTALYFKPFIDRLRVVKENLMGRMLIAKQALSDSAIAKPKVFAFQVPVYLC